jgi:hypothetical protein
MTHQQNNDALSDADTSKVPKRRNLMQGRHLEKVWQEETPDILKIVLCIVFALGLLLLQGHYKQD